jgi:hypothetical protein
MCPRRAALRLRSPEREQQITVAALAIFRSAVTGYPRGPTYAVRSDSCSSRSAAAASAEEHRP